MEPMEGQTALQALLETKRIYTIKRFAKVTGLTPQRAWQLWHGKTGISVKTALQVAKATEIPVETLLTLFDQPPAEGRAAIMQG